MSAPSVDAGVDQTINDNQVLMLTGVVTTGTYPLTYVLWTQVSGPDCTILAASSWIAQVYNLFAGTYVFQFAAYDQVGGSGTNTISVVVSDTSGPLYIPQSGNDWYPEIGYTKPLYII